jgi:hypothetical protein
MSFYLHALLEKEEKSHCADPRHQQKCAGGYSKHYQRAEIVTAWLAAQWSTFFHSVEVILRKPTVKSLV